MKWQAGASLSVMFVVAALSLGFGHEVPRTRDYYEGTAVEWGLNNHTSVGPRMTDAHNYILVKTEDGRQIVCRNPYPIVDLGDKVFIKKCADGLWTIDSYLVVR